MIKEYIEVLDNLRPEEVRFDFDPLNKNLCFGGGGGGSGSGVETEGGLSPEDKEMKDLLYGKIKGMFDQEYSPYEGDMYQDRSPEELALLEQMQGGHPMFDKASKDLGFAQDIYKKGTEYGVEQLDKDAAQLMGAGSTYRNAVRDQVLQDMNRGASMSGMDLTAQAHGQGAFGGDRGDVTRGLSNRGYLEAAGGQLAKLNLGAYDRSLNRARQTQQDRLGAAGSYEKTALGQLGIGKDKYGSRMDAFGRDRAFGDRQLSYDKKMWDEKQNFPYKQLAFGSGLYSGMPFEEKVVSNQSASGGK